jgi:hypothetical protein
VELIGVKASKLNDYRMNIQSLPSDTDGIYMLLEGKAKVVNHYDNYDLRSITKLEAFGEHKYLQNKDYSYYGDIVASDEGITTCFFIKESKLHLIPYYDLIKLK